MYTYTIDDFINEFSDKLKILTSLKDEMDIFDNDELEKALKKIDQFINMASI